MNLPVATGATKSLKRIRMRTIICWANRAAMINWG